jgi:putative transposase
MAKKGHSEEEILRVPWEAESGTTVVEVCRKHGISQQIFDLWKRKYAGLGLSELRELRQLRDENGKLKRLARNTYCIVIMLGTLLLSCGARLRMMHFSTPRNNEIRADYFVKQCSAGRETFDRTFRFRLQLAGGHVELPFILDIYIKEIYMARTLSRVRSVACYPRFPRDCALAIPKPAILSLLDRSAPIHEPALSI